MRDAILGRLVNITNTDHILDIYEEFGKSILKDDFIHEHKHVLIELISKGLNLRSLVKSFLKPYNYGLVQFGYTDKLMVEFKKSLKEASKISKLMFDSIDYIYPQLTIAKKLLDEIKLNKFNVMDDLSFNISYNYVKTTNTRKSITIDGNKIRINTSN